MKTEKVFVFTNEEKVALKKYLNGEITTREAGKVLNCSHQQVINMVGMLAKNWYQKGKVEI